jgi:hypothetical protein
MSRPGLVRLVAALAGVALFLALFAAIGGAGGLLAGFAGAGTVWWLGERIWRRVTTAEQRRSDLEDRVRNPPP